MYCAKTECHCTKVHTKCAKIVDEKIIDCFVVYVISSQKYCKNVIFFPLKKGIHIVNLKRQN